MFTYEALKIIHIISAFVFIGMALVTMFLAGKTRILNLIFMAGSLATVFAGMALIPHMGGGFPTWIMIKFGVWIVLMGVLGFVTKRFPALALPTSVVVFVLTAIAVYVAVVKPT